MYLSTKISFKSFKNINLKLKQYSCFQRSVPLRSLVIALSRKGFKNKILKMSKPKAHRSVQRSPVVGHCASAGRSSFIRREERRGRISLLVLCSDADSRGVATLGFALHQFAEDCANQVMLSLNVWGRPRRPISKQPSYIQRYALLRDAHRS